VKELKLEEKLANQDRNFKIKINKVNLESQVNEIKSQIHSLKSEIKTKDRDINEKIYIFQPNRFNKCG